MTAFPVSAEEEIFRGYELDDIERVERLKVTTETPKPGFLIDFFGIHVALDLIDRPEAVIIDHAPFPWDGYLADGVEYASAAIALEQTSGPTFTMMEIGAGWGPWTTLLAKLALRKGFETIKTVAIEASPARFALLQRHLFNNGLLPDPHATEAHTGPVHIKLLNGAGWWRNTTLFFPATGAASDAGMAAQVKNKGTDYRGLHLRNQPVRAYSMGDLINNLGTVDFLHFDVQGSEWEILRHSKRILDKKVRFMFVGTHSRQIEGDIVGLFLNQGWKLFREKPCRFYGMADAPTITGLTHLDGGQLWRNMALP